MSLLIVHVHVHVKPEHRDAFQAATLANARSSRQEAGVVRFDVVQQIDDSTHFVLIEIYRDSAAAAGHKETTHYALWRDTVAPMMTSARVSVKFTNVFPDDGGW
jgi:quinol monooxygenase YgiN